MANIDFARNLNNLSNLLTGQIRGCPVDLHIRVWQVASSRMPALLVARGSSSSDQLGINSLMAAVSSKELPLVGD